MACASSASREALPRVSEIVCFRLDGSLDTLVVAPNLTDLNAAGGGRRLLKRRRQHRRHRRVKLWTANAGNGRLDAFLVRIRSCPAGQPTSDRPY
jgi:hypothetical protein